MTEPILMLAPMAGMTDRHFRRVCAACGAGYAVTEMVSSKALCYEQHGKRAALKSASLAAVDPDCIPTAVQLFGSDPEFMAEAARLISEGSYRGCRSAAPAAIDINMGCPVRKVVGAGDGSALMRNLPLAGRVIEAVVRATSLPVTVKMRAGWDDEHINAPELARIAQESGASLLCVHARTRERFYTPGIDLGVIAAVKRAVSVPVVGNGDIFTAADALKMMSETDCDGVAVARGALGNPWIFSEISAALSGAPYTPPDAAERLKTALSQVTAMAEEKGARGIAEAKGHLTQYVKNLHGAAALRGAINSASTLDEMRDILSEVIGGEKE